MTHIISQAMLYMILLSTLSRAIYFYYFYVASHRLSVNAYYDRKESHNTIKKLIDLFVLEYKQINRDYDRIYEIMHVLKTCLGDYRMRYRRKFKYNEIV